IGGVGAVIIFLPQIVILFFFLGLLEDSGYLPRAAFIVDRLFRWCGLSGKSFVPLLSSFACAIPGIMATRTIQSPRQRLLTIVVAPLMSCSARLPVYTIMISAFIPYQSYLGVFNSQGLTMLGLYFLGIVTAVAVSLLLKKQVAKGATDSFAMELPTYKTPTLKGIWLRTSISASAFLKRAGTIILAISVIVWALSYYPRAPEINTAYDTQLELALADAERELEAIASSIEPGLAPEDFSRRAQDAISGADSVGRSLWLDARGRFSARVASRDTELRTLKDNLAGENLRQSFLGRTGRTLEPLFEPLGWDWRVTMSALAAFPAREVVIATLGTVYNLGADEDETSISLVEKLRGSTRDSGPRAGEPVFNVAVAMSLMVFFALCCQCGATLAVIRRETGSWGWAAFTFSYMTALAYAGAWAAYRLTSIVAL
ncbi:MAG: nucleoside recognition domain-containing protein, partial [Candidatus Zixiibacteriota bacterium]